MLHETIMIGGVPRSGTSWLGQLFDSSPVVRYRFQPLFSYAFKGRIDSQSSDGEINCFLEDLWASRDEFLSQSDKRKSGQYPEFVKSEQQRYLVFKENRYQYLFRHMLSVMDDLKFIGIVRNPCAVINSWIRNEKEFPPGSSVQAEWRKGECKNQGRKEEYFGFDKWCEIARLYASLIQEFPEKVLIVRYEDLVADTRNMVEEMFNFSGLDMNEQTLEFIDECHSREVSGPYAVFKSKDVVSRWKGQLPTNIVEEIHENIRGTALQRYLN